jgi:hypothetical protein
MKMNKFDKIMESVLEEGSKDWEMHGGDGRGHIMVFRGNGVDKVAKAFGIKSDDWELEQIGPNLWGATDGDRVTIMTDKRDFIPNEEY